MKDRKDEQQITETKIKKMVGVVILQIQMIKKSPRILI